MTQGPATRPISKAVPQASTARNVMYSKTPKARICESDNQRASSSNIVISFGNRLELLFKSLNYSFHTCTAGAFYENIGGCQSDQTLQRRIDVIKRFGVLTERLGALASRWSESQKVVNAFLPGIGSDFCMHGGALITHFGHVAQDKDFSARQLRQHIDGCTHRIGVRIIRIVDQLKSTRQRRRLHAS